MCVHINLCGSILLNSGLVQIMHMVMTRKQSVDPIGMLVDMAPCTERLVLLQACSITMTLKNKFLGVFFPWAHVFKEWTNF